MTKLETRCKKVNEQKGSVTILSHLIGWDVKMPQ